MKMFLLHEDGMNVFPRRDYRAENKSGFYLLFVFVKRWAASDDFYLQTDQHQEASQLRGRVTAAAAAVVC